MPQYLAFGIVAEREEIVSSLGVTGVGPAESLEVGAVRSGNTESRAIPSRSRSLKVLYQSRHVDDEVNALAWCRLHDIFRLELGSKALDTAGQSIPKLPEDSGVRSTRRRTASLGLLL